MRSVGSIALSLSLLYLAIEGASGIVSSATLTNVKSDVHPRPLLKSFTPRGSKVVSAHGRDDGETLRPAENQSYIRILLRSLRLIAIFSPSILTAWLAILIPPFQGLWFRMFSVSLAYSGAAFIKWGQV